jgi:hypothetical protein
MGPAYPDTPLCYFIFTYVLSACPDRSMSRPHRLRRKTISIIIHSFIRFRSLGTIPEMHILIIIKFV